jgi:hypothetical protein
MFTLSKGETMKYIIAILLLLSLTSCGVLDPVYTINNLKKPVYIVTCNEGGLTLSGADGEIVFFPEDYYITIAANKQGFKTGDIYIPKD